MRQRTIKPRFLKDERFQSISCYARLAYLSLLCYADDWGVLFLSDINRIKKEIFPYDEIDLDQILDELEEAGLILRYGEKRCYVYFIDFQKTQKVDRPNFNKRQGPLPEGVFEGNSQKEISEKNFGENFRGKNSVKKFGEKNSEKNFPEIFSSKNEESKEQLFEKRLEVLEKTITALTETVNKLLDFVNSLKINSENLQKSEKNFDEIFKNEKPVEYTKVYSNKEGISNNNKEEANKEEISKEEEKKEEKENNALKEKILYFSKELDGFFSKNGVFGNEQKMQVGVEGVDEDITEGRSEKDLEQKMKQEELKIKDPLEFFSEKARNKIDKEIKKVNKLPEVKDIPPCPYKKIVELYHQILPRHPRCIEITSRREKTMRQRWEDVFEKESILARFVPEWKELSISKKELGLLWFRRFFEYVGESKFLTGTTNQLLKDRPFPFLASLEWLMEKRNFLKVIEGFYHKRESPLDDLTPEGRWNVIIATKTLEKIKKEYEKQGGVK